MIRRRFAVIAALAALAATTLLPSVTPTVLASAYGPSSSVWNEFDNAADWHLSGAVGTEVGSPKTSGSGALKVDYNLTNTSSASITRAGTPGDFQGLPRKVSVDVYGDGSWNVVYFEVRDETGEILRYWVGNLSFTGWQTMSVDIGSAVPVSGQGGNQDKVLDLPAKFSQIVIYKSSNPNKIVSTIYMDNLAYQYDPVGATADSPIFVPSAGASSVVRVTLADSGSFNLRLIDEDGRTKTYGGTAGNGSNWAATWNGRDDSGNVMSGSVRGLLAVTRGTTESYQYPYFAGLPVRPAGSNPAQRGVNSFITQHDTIGRGAAETQVRSMEAAYVGMAREEFEWKRVEPSPGVYDWSKFDQAVELERAHGIAILGKLVYGSPWDNTAPAGTSADSAVMYPPGNLQNYVDYAVETVRRYKDRVHYWEIWNEENNTGFWEPSANAARYTQLLKQTYAAIKAEDPSATVVLGGLSTGLDASYVQGIVANGGWGSFDVLAIHSYVSGQPDGSAFERWITSAQSTVATYGSKPIWITEFGWSSTSARGGVSAANQNQYLMRAYEIATNDGVAGISWYSFQNMGTNAGDIGQNYGLVNNDLSAKASYGGFQCEAQAINAGNIPNCTGSAPPPPPPAAPPSNYPDSTFTGIKPTRLLDTRLGLGLSGAFVSGFPRTFGVAGDLGGSRGTIVPSSASAVTGNLTVTGSNSGGFVYLGPDWTTNPSSSTINFPSGDNRANGITVPLDSTGSLTAVFMGASGRSTQLVLDITGYFMPGTSGAYYVAVAPVRLLDSRNANGLSGSFQSKVPRTFGVAGRWDSNGNVVVPANAQAVTGNLTLTNQTSTGFAYIGQDSTNNPSSSTVNAPVGDNRANNLVVALDSTGSLSAVFVGTAGSHADLIFDVTGYFTASGGWTYVPVTPTRLLDSRSGNALSGQFVSRTPRTFGVSGRTNVSSGALAATGNLTVVNQTAVGFGFAAPSAPANPGSSTINFPVGDIRANGVSLQLSPSGTLDVVYVAAPGARCDFIFDVTGYYH
jgi:hypothetical protein